MTQVLATVGDSRTSARVVLDKDALNVFSGGFKYELFIPLPSYAVAKSEAGEGSLVTPMPCKISQVFRVKSILGERKNRR